MASRDIAEFYQNVSKGSLRGLFEVPSDSGAKCPVFSLRGFQARDVSLFSSKDDLTA
jgi:hypothetical protein